LVHAISLFAALYGIWLALSGHYTPFLLVAGAVCTVIVVAIAWRMDVIDHEGQPVQLTWRLPAYWAWLSVQIFIAAVDVARRVLSPRLDIDPALERIPTSQRTDLGRVIYANSITLTPGTVSTDVGGDTIEVHALTRKGLDDLKAGAMDRRVSRLDGRP
jgi:multicomponent Na+:H+ antiporter subunit E